MLQDWLKSKAFTGTAGALIAAYIRFVRRTNTMTDDPPDFVLHNLPDLPLIIAMWHGQGMLLPYLRTRDDIKVAIMVARHVDGDIVHETLDRFGMTTIRGAGSGRTGKDKGGFAALRACMKALRGGTSIATTRPASACKARAVRGTQAYRKVRRGHRASATQPSPPLRTRSRDRLKSSG